MTSESWLAKSRRGGWAEDWARYTGDPTRQRHPIGPRNTWSNLMYAVVGVLLASRFQDSQSAWMAMSLCILAVGSAAYHAFKTVAANRLDWIGMYAVFGALVGHAWWPAHTGTMAMASAGIVGLYAQRGWKNADWHMAVALGLAIIPLLRSGHWLPVWHVLLLFGIGYAAWQADRRRMPFVGLWGHALWHVFTALAIGLLFASQHELAR